MLKKGCPSTFEPIPGINSFNGATWKGTKLRVGEAKPDYLEESVFSVGRLSRTDIQPNSSRMSLTRPSVTTKHTKTPKELKIEKKLRKRAARSTVGRFSSDMSLVNLDTAKRRKVISPLDRLSVPTNNLHYSSPGR
jgi:hypothetical protein